MVVNFCIPRLACKRVLNALPNKGQRSPRDINSPIPSPSFVADNSTTSWKAMEFTTYVNIAEVIVFTSFIFIAFWIFSQSSKFNFLPCLYITILCGTRIFTSSYELSYSETIGIHDFPDTFGFSLILLSMLSILWPM